MNICLCSVALPSTASQVIVDLICYFLEQPCHDQA